MGNCANKPATKEGEAPAPEEKAEEIAVESREIVVGEEETKVIGEEAKLGVTGSSTQQPSLSQLIQKTEGEKTATEAGKTIEEAVPTPLEPAKEVAAASKTEEEGTTKEPELKKEAEDEKEAAVEAEKVVVAEEEKK